MGKRKLKARASVKASVKIDAYEVICRAVETGIAYGYNRAYKHTEKPDEQTFKEAMYNAVTPCWRSWKSSTVATACAPRPRPIWPSPL